MIVIPFILTLLPYFAFFSF